MKPRSHPSASAQDLDSAGWLVLLSALSGSALAASRRPARRRAAGPARLGLFLLLSALASACEIKFGVDDSTQGPYAAGSTVIFRLRVDLTHQDCPVEMKDTKIQGIGLNILGATPWQKTSPNVWERKLKVAIASSPAGKVTLSAKRSCDKDGGWGAYTIESTLLKL
jgi:hypothetical protein